MQDTEMADEDSNAGGDEEDDEVNEVIGTTHGENPLVAADDEDNTDGIERMTLEATAGGSGDVAEPAPNPW